MKNRDHIDKKIEEALESFDGAARAEVKPYLFTRLTARMQRQQQSSWDKAVKFITRPAIAMAGLCLVISINAMVIAYKSPASSTGSATDQLATTDEFSTSVTTLYYAENNEP